jgi:hypothetical protein
MAGDDFHIPRQGKLKKNIGKHTIVIVVLVLAAVIIPTVIYTAGVGAGIIPHPTSINYVAFKTLDEISGKSTMNFEMMKSPGGRYLDKVNPFTIIVDGKEATNQSIAATSGLQVTLDPPTGLAYEEGSQLKIMGLPPSSKVEIIANFQDGIHKNILSY